MYLINSIANHDIIELKGNHLLKGLVPLERLFDKNDAHRKHSHKVVDNKVEDCNLGSDENPKMVKLCSSLPTNFRQIYVDLLKEFADVFAWSYEDLKIYDKGIIQHKIPLKENTKPFRQKLR